MSTGHDAMNVRWEIPVEAGCDGGRMHEDACGWPYAVEMDIVPLARPGWSGGAGREMDDGRRR